MTPGAKSVAIIARLFAATLAMAAGAVAWRMGGGAERPSPPPHPSAVAPATSGASAEGTAHGNGGRAGDSYEAFARLVEVATDARFDMPHAEASHLVLKSHWR